MRRGSRPKRPASNQRRTTEPGTDSMRAGSQGFRELSSALSIDALTAISAPTSRPPIHTSALRGASFWALFVAKPLLLVSWSPPFGSTNEPAQRAAGPPTADCAADGLWPASLRRALRGLPKARLSITSENDRWSAWRQLRFSSYPPHLAAHSSAKLPSTALTVRRSG